MMAGNHQIGVASQVGVDDIDRLPHPDIDTLDRSLRRATESRRDTPE